MIHITLGSKRDVIPEEDQLGRDHVGWDSNMDDEAIFRANRGCWVLGERAEKERYALLSCERKVRMAIEIDRLVPVAGGRKAIEGRFLKAGNEVYDAYVGDEPPVGSVRNPITYFDSEHDSRLCGCGCGEQVASGWFLIGHDQKALHARVSKIGTVREFIDWFDTTYVEPQAQ
ncbi:hypothetical protein OG304_06325 [Streptomyces sp. NBC_00160]|uniref:hypothetical protein n=1 Tax=Streptomyces sp. NBC_00160 TaxID=2903628 RepID=UPI002250C80E|nr:hypothetical protein [Streptomyces sp. NBC_00160]MCX5303068.1 hypothetical protein [Streptomyces sp. NBC_00160]